jgi:hypothetical protein
MPAYYLSIEGTKTGERSDPATDKLVCLQYQKIDPATGEPLDVLVILREWESSEKDVVTTFYNQFFKPGLPLTDFIPVGLNLDYCYEMLLALFRKYGLAPPTSHELYYQRLRFDLKPIIVLLNNGSFAGASLDAFSLKKGEDRHMEKWYGKQDYGRIEHYVREEAGRFLKVFQYLSKYKTRLGITVRETAPAARKAPRTPVPADGTSPVNPATPLPPAPRERPAPTAAETGKPVYRESRPAPAHASAPRSPEPRERSPARGGEYGKFAPRDNRPVPSHATSSRSPEPRERTATRSEETGRHIPRENRPAPSRSSPPRSPEPGGRPAPGAEESGKPAPRDRPAAKKAPRKLLPAPERTAADRKRAPAGKNQLLRHPAAKEAPGKKGPAKRR